MKARLKILIILLSMPISVLADGGPYSIMGCDTPVLDYVEPDTPSIVIADAMLSEGQAARLMLNADKNEIAVTTESSDTVALIKVDDESVLRFMTMDPHAYSYPSASPYNYCMGDPINFIDPTGMTIEGMTKEDAKIAVDDIRALFPGKVFENFRSLIVQSGKNADGRKLAKINQDALDAAFSGVNLTKDQKALVDIVVKTINSKKTHVIEYVSTNEGEDKFLLSDEAAEVFNEQLSKTTMTKDGSYRRYKGVPGLAIEPFGGVTEATRYGSISVVVLYSDKRHYGRALDTGHELFGHGRLFDIPGSEEEHHTEVIRLENLIRRVMGIPGVNDGSNHMTKEIITEPTKLPNYR